MRALQYLGALSKPLGHAGVFCGGIKRKARDGARVSCGRRSHQRDRAQTSRLEDLAPRGHSAQADACDKTCLSSSAHRARPWRPLRAPLALPRVVRLVRTSSQHCIIRSCRRSTPTSCYRPFFRTSFSYRQQHPIRINHCAPRSAFAPGSSSSHQKRQSHPGAKATASSREIICRPPLPPLLHPHAPRSCSSFASRPSPRRS